jgi:hypothetical protein
LISKTREAGWGLEEQLNVIIIHRGAPLFRSGNLIFPWAFDQNWKYRNISQIDEWQRLQTAQQGGNGANLVSSTTETMKIKRGT